MQFFVAIGARGIRNKRNKQFRCHFRRQPERRASETGKISNFDAILEGSLSVGHRKQEICNQSDKSGVFIIDAG